MSKKVISILLSAAMLVAMLCVGAVAVSADSTVTYYFLAPDEYFATNDSVGYYYWAPEENGAWPGLEMTPAPEVGKNVFKCECPDMDSTSTIIFNAFVDAGTPADPELAAVAHQTLNINTEGYMAGESDIYDELGMELDDFAGMIYVLANDDDHRSVNEYSGAVTTSGEWFSIDPTAANYYRNYEVFYGSYGLTEDDSTSDTDAEPSTKQYHAGDKVTVSYMVKNADHIGSLSGHIMFNPDILAHEPGDYVKPALAGTPVINDLQATEQYKGMFSVVNTYDVMGTESYFAGSEPVAAVTFNFTAIKDFNVEDLQLSYVTAELLILDNSNVENPYVYLVENLDYDMALAANDEYTSIAYEITCDHEPATDSDSDTDTVVDTDTATDSDTDTTTTDSEPTSSVTSSEAPTSSTTSDSDTKNTQDNASSKTSSTTSNKTTSTSTTTTATVQTAGTFAVVSLVVILMAAAAVVLYTRKKTEE